MYPKETCFACNGELDSRYNYETKEYPKVKLCTKCAPSISEERGNPIAWQKHVPISKLVVWKFMNRSTPSLGGFFLSKEKYDKLMQEIAYDIQSLEEELECRKVMNAAPETVKEYDDKIKKLQEETEQTVNQIKNNCAKEVATVREALVLECEKSNKLRLEIEELKDSKKNWDSTITRLQESLKLERTRASVAADIIKEQEDKIKKERKPFEPIPGILGKSESLDIANLTQDEQLVAAVEEEVSEAIEELEKTENKKKEYCFDCGAEIEGEAKSRLLEGNHPICEKCVQDTALCEKCGAESTKESPIDINHTDNQLLCPSCRESLTAPQPVEYVNITLNLDSSATPSITDKKEDDKILGVDLAKEDSYSIESVISINDLSKLLEVSKVTSFTPEEELKIADSNLHCCIALIARELGMSPTRAPEIVLPATLRKLRSLKEKIPTLCGGTPVAPELSQLIWQWWDEVGKHSITNPANLPLRDWAENPSTIISIDAAALKDLAVRLMAISYLRYPQPTIEEVADLLKKAWADNDMAYRKIDIREMRLRDWAEAIRNMFLK